MIKVFEYRVDLHCFVVTPEYKKIADHLGLSEWNEVVWIGRYFALDNDYGEHWFDNWDLRELISEKATSAGLDETDLFIIDAERFKNDYDGPCHTEDERKLFWTDVLMSLSLSLGTIAREARKLNEERRMHDEEEYIPDLELRIASLMASGT